MLLILIKSYLIKLVTGSSIMPQKKNPDPLEYLRGKTQKLLLGILFSMISILKGITNILFQRFTR